jgi:DUF971 family protein
MSEHHIKGMTENPRPTNLVLHQKSQVLEILFDDGSQFNLPCEYLRVYSPSAAVKGHGPGQEVLQYGKQNVGIDRIEPQGAYAVKLCFNDGHESGIYTWKLLYKLGVNYAELWQDYLRRLEEAGRKRSSSIGDIPVVVRTPASQRPN